MKYSVKAAYENLDYWFMLGIDSDIYDCPDQRPEYKPFVNQAKHLNLQHREITLYVANKLKIEMNKPFWSKYRMYLMCLNIKHIVNKIIA